MTYRISNLDSVLASVAGVPMTLESGISFDSDLTAMLMSCAPFFIKPYYDGFKLVAPNGSLLFFIDHVCEAETYENGYTFFRDCEGKYNFTTYYDIRRKQSKPFPLSYPIMEKPNLVFSYDDLPASEKAFASEYWEGFADRYGDVKKYFIDSHNEREMTRVNHSYEVAVSDYKQERKVWDALGFCKIGRTKKVDRRPYCDTKSEETFVFSRSITKEEFISYLKMVGKEVKKAKAWYDSYSIIDGKGSNWTYTWVIPSTH